MTQKSFKFAPSDTIKFVELYKKHECLWNTEHENYKNRDARNAALLAFSQELNIDGFETDEILVKIKNIRSQYLQELKKMKASMKSGKGKIHKPKLRWFGLLDSFLRKGCEFESTSSNLKKCDTTKSADSEMSLCIENTHSETTHMAQTNDEKGHPKPIRKTTIVETNHAETSLYNVDATKKKSYSPQEDDLETFGNYVVASLRRLNATNCISAQDEIQSVLSKYKLRNLLNIESTSAPTSSLPVQPLLIKCSSPVFESGDEEQW